MNQLMRRFAYPTLALHAVLLASCASSPDLLTEQLKRTPVEKHAYILGTYVVNCEPVRDRCQQMFNAASTHYRAIANNKIGGHFNSVSDSLGSDTHHDFVDMEHKEKGYHFCIPVPAGDYEFYTFAFYNFAGGGNGFYLKDEEQFSLPFSLAEGELAYIGRLKLTSTFKTNFLGMKIRAPGTLFISSDDHATRMAALEKCPENVRGRAMRDAALKIKNPKAEAKVQMGPAP